MKWTTELSSTHWSYLGAFGLTAIIFAAQMMPQVPTRSVEVAFADTSPTGLGILPASCESSPPFHHYTGECTCPTELSNTGDSGGYVIGAGELQHQANRQGVFFCIDNSGANSYFIPTRTLNELQLFQSRVPQLPGLNTYQP